MTRNISNALHSAIIFIVVTIFLFLIGFTTTGSELIIKALSPSIAKTSEGLEIGFTIFISLIGFIIGLVASKREEPDTLGRNLVAGTIAGLISGVVIGLFGFLMGTLIENGIDLRGYLQSVSPDSMRKIVFDQPPNIGALRLGGIILLSSIFGSFINSTVIRAEWRKSLSTSVSESSTADSVRKTASKLGANQGFRMAMMAVLAAILIILPQQWGSYWNFVMGTVGIYILLGIGVNLIIGLAGQLILGYVAFFAIGAYTFALLTAPAPHNLQWNFWIAVGLAMISATIGSLFIGLPILNLRGDYLAIVTLGFGEIIRILVKSDLLTKFTGGPRGVRDIPGPTIFGQSFSSDVDYMYLIIAAVVVTAFVANRLQNSATGRAWVAIREDETVSKTTGVNSFAYKLLAFALSAAIAGLAGALFASRNQFTGPDDHVLMVSINVLCLLIVGGMGSLPGILLGAFTLKGLPELLRELENYRLLIFGALLVVMMLIRPEGLWPATRPKLEEKGKSIEAQKGEPT
ncbi:MAG: hypothetical protein HPY76_09070 [Anaerolineae bacterium]|jgi:ABC-type branched-subunit amino acid transport system permease subunit|nr:hypothetical protein [Anaerolineae bacterium]